MNQLKAFVGHSFDEEDEKLVKAFLDFFNSIKGMNIGFDWEDAKPAEPKALAEKVLTLTKDKNLFIGICTKREYAIDPSKLIQRTWPYKDTFCTKKTDLIWKTSDWIIQEIGLCIGRGMDIILLVEKDLRPPGGLQGDLEYIPFERRSPERSYNKLLEMIKALIPKSIGQTATAESISKSEREEKPAEGNSSEWAEPKEDWPRRKFEIALLRAIGSGNKADEDKVFQAYLSSKEGRKATTKAGWEAAREYFKVLLHKGDGLKHLQEIAQNNPTEYEVQLYLAKGFNRYDEFEKAADRFQIAANNPPSDEERASRLGDAAIAFSKAGLIEKSRLLINEMAKISSKIKNEEIILKRIRDLSGFEKEDDIYLASSEALLDFHPDDVDMRFELAFKYSELNQEDLALYHYKKIQVGQRSATTWNNIGVANSRLDLKSNAIPAYRKAEELGSTLAMSNLANQFIGAGFLIEADEVCQRAIKIENYDKEIGNSISWIKKVEKEDREKEGTILKNTKQRRDFYRKFGRACGKQLPTIPSGNWAGPKCILNLEVNGGKLLAKGNYEITESALVSALLYTRMAVQYPPQKTTKYTIRYTGVLWGHSVSCKSELEVVGEVSTASLLTGPGKEKKEVLMIISDDLNEISVYEKEAPEREAFYSIKSVK